MNYYHAGSMDENNEVRWSDKTRKLSHVAEAEARKIAAKHGGKPIVEYWDRRNGLRPGGSNVVAGMYHPTES
jgi:hypothetical protein